MLDECEGKMEEYIIKHKQDQHLSQQNFANNLQKCPVLKNSKRCQILNNVEVTKLDNGVSIIDTHVTSWTAGLFSSEFSSVNGTQYGNNVPVLQLPCIAQYIEQVFCVPYFRQHSELCDKNTYLEDVQMDHILHFHRQHAPLHTPFNSQVSTVLRIGYTVFVHSDVALALNLLHTIFEEQHWYVIHVDRKMSTKDITLLHQFSAQHHNVEVLHDQFSIYPQGISWVYAQLCAIMALLRKGTWNYMINLSENDFPIKTNNAITATLLVESQNGSKNFIEHNLISNSSAHFNELHHYFVACEGGTLVGGHREITPGEFFHGTPWFVLSRGFCEHLVLSATLTVLLSFLHTTNGAPEIFFSTAIMQSPFSQTVDQRNWHYTAWGRNNKKLWEKDIPGLEKMEQLFVRKIYSLDVQNSIVKNVLNT